MLDEGPDYVHTHVHFWMDSLHQVLQGDIHSEGTECEPAVCLLVVFLQIMFTFSKLFQQRLLLFFQGVGERLRHTF